jgi:hypothetical protein
MQGAVDFSLAEAVAAIHAEIFGALMNVVEDVSAQRRALLPERIRISAHVTDAVSGSERFLLSATTGAGPPELIEFQWHCDAPLEVRIVSADRDTSQSSQEISRHGR